MLAGAPETPLPAEYERLLPEFAASHCTPAVRGLLAAGVPVDAPGDHGGTALHWACWKGYADLVKMLLDAGASLTMKTTHFMRRRPDGSRMGWRIAARKTATTRKWRGCCLPPALRFRRATSDR